MISVFILWLFSVKPIEAFSFPPECTSTSTYICYRGSVPYPSDDNSEGCKSCGNDCTTVPPVKNYTCFPATKTCRVCGTLSSTDISTVVGTGYTLTYQNTCDAVKQCGDVSVENITYQSFQELIIEGRKGAGAVQKMDVQCPLQFIGIAKLTIRNLVINCVQNNQADTRPGIIIQATKGMTLNINNVAVKGHLRTALLIYGGDFRSTPPVSSTDLTGSISNFHMDVFTTRMDPPVLLAAANFFSTSPLEISDISEHSRFVVQPSLSPSGTTSNFKFSGRGTDTRILTNLSALIEDFGQVYETQFYHEGSYSSTEYEGSTYQKEALQIQTFAFGVLSALLAILHGNVFYYYSHASALE